MVSEKKLGRRQGLELKRLRARQPELAQAGPWLGSKEYWRFWRGRRWSGSRAKANAADRVIFAIFDHDRVIGIGLEQRAWGEHSPCDPYEYIHGSIVGCDGLSRGALQPRIPRRIRPEQRVGRYVDVSVYGDAGPVYVTFEGAGCARRDDRASTDP